MDQRTPGLWTWIELRSRKEKGVSVAKMAGQSAAAKLSFMILGWCMIVFGGLCGLLALIFTILKNPFTAFKKTPRDGMRSP